GGAGGRGGGRGTRAARGLAAFEGRKVVTDEDVRGVSPRCLRHRLRRDPLEPAGGDARVRNCVPEIFGDAPTGGDGKKKKSGPTDGQSFEADGPRGERRSGGADYGGGDYGGGRARSAGGGNPE